MTTRAVLYARVSGDDRSKEGRNLAGQLDMGREYAQERGYQVVAELAEDDRGASGAEINLPQLTRARDMAAAGEFDILVVREIDRLSRSLAKQLIVEQELQQAGVQIEYVLGEYPDTPEGNLQKHVKAAVAEYDRDKTSERMSRGRRLKVLAGHVVGHGRAPYGYRLVENNGKRTFEIYESEARIVRVIFNWYIYGDQDNEPLTMYAIARRLTKESVPTKGDKDPRIAKQHRWGKWSKSGVARILRNETYAGTWYYGKAKKVKANNGKRVTVNNPREHWLPVEVPVIVDRELWERAQKRLQQNKDRARRNTKHQYLMRRRLTCGECGAKMGAMACRSGKSGLNLYYSCPARYDPDFVHKCSQRSFRADRVDVVMWGW